MLGRAWSQPPRTVVVAASGAAKAPRHTLTAMTYNLLADKYARGGWHGYCPPQHLTWDSRRERILQEIESYSSDIICLQEVEAQVFAGELQPWLAARGYRGHYLPRQYGDSVHGPPEGVALFYRTEVFDLEQQHSFLFNSVPTSPPAPGSALASLADAEEPSAVGAAAAVVAAVTAAADTVGSGRASGSEVGAVVDSDAPQAAAEAPVASTSGNAEAANSRKRERRSGSKARGASGSGSEDSSDEEEERRAAASGSGNGGGGASTSGRGRSNEFWSMFKKRQEGAILALLRHRASKRQLLAACTHLFWNPAFADVKAFQATVLCSEMAGFLTRHVGPDAPSSVPVVLGGDFNSVACKRVPDVFDPKLPRDGQASGVYALLTRGSLPPSHPDHPASRRRPGEAANADFKGQPLTTSGIQLASSYVVAHGMDPPLTTRTNNFAGCLDYIFVSPRHFDVLRTLELPYEHSSGEEAPRGDPGRGGAGGGKGEAAGTYPGVRDPMDVPFPPIPNEVFPSDHLSLAVVLGLR
ncbi:hypothetical protein CHLRE_12g504000v5 [Chlamydomonas reinhardtii]|uniref:Endonuclease/exonuclease/phosphatase domain-containing protein n=1 Tax=Chlamydomonas reinhardtii TaxID=3055 RepID=A0A2K3D327_CHLRE|nr:uncharacterized protein CHLRE_12g504000v5 [Chlamydomonas reinhardtii]PNW74930.1 hypothetical protein CHLRE_12g504000v5 [Chlamydomonas reinhardtii]